VLPITLDVARLKVALVGRGDAVLRRLDALDAADARRLVVFSDAPSPALAARAGDRLRRRLPAPGELAGCRLVVIAGLPEALSETLAAQASASGALVNVEDATALCDVHMPAVVRRGALAVAISTGGRSPGLARLLKGVLERLLDARWGAWLDELAAQRARWRDAGLTMAAVSQRTAALVCARGWLRGLLVPIEAFRDHSAVIASEAKQSRIVRRPSGLLRRSAPRNDEGLGDYS